MMKRIVALTTLGALLMLCFSGCALTYSKTRVSGCKEIKECGLLGGLIPLHKSEKPLKASGCGTAQGCAIIAGHGMPPGHPDIKGRGAVPQGHPKISEHAKPEHHPMSSNPHKASDASLVS